MEIKLDLIKAEIVTRHNSLIYDVKLSDDSIVQVFSAASTIRALCTTGVEVYISLRKKANSKIHYNLEMISLPTGLIWVNPKHDRELFLEAFKSGNIPELANYDTCRIIEPKEKMLYADFKLSNEYGEICYISLENVYNKIAGQSVFPTKVNFFELNMLHELEMLRKSGAKTSIFIIVPRMDCLECKFIWNKDSVGAAQIYEAAQKGLEFICYSCKINKNSVSIANKLNIVY